MKNRVSAALLLLGALLTSLAWTGESWGQADVRRVGILFPDVDVLRMHWWELFRRTLADRGWVKGKNVSFEVHHPSGNPPDYADAAAALARLEVDVIWATSAPATRAAHAATRAIPIVAWDYTTDPVEAGYIESYARPGKNLTGVFLDAPEFAGKLVELLKNMVPDLSSVVVLWDPSPGEAHFRAVEKAAASFGLRLQVFKVRTPADIDHAFVSMRERPRALIILPSPMIYNQSKRLARLALKNRLLATSMFNEFTSAGGALAYGPDAAWVVERNAVMLARILSGKKPAELPVERPTTFRLVVNLKTAKALGITIPQSVLIRADEVIQ